MTEPIRVLIADDETLIRAGFRALIDAEPGMIVVGEAADGAAAVDLAQQTHPDVVLMDIRMPGVDGLDATRQIAEAPDLAHAHVLILTTFDHDEYVIEALGAGASGFVNKNTDPGQLLHGIRVVAGGEALLSPGLTRRLVARLVDRAPNRQVNAEALAQLTEREREVAGLAAYGMSNDEIAEHLVISPATAKTHISRAMTKLSAREDKQADDQPEYEQHRRMVRSPWSRRESRFRAPQVAQRFNTQKITFDGQGIRLLPVALRYSWPSELDLMAGQADRPVPPGSGATGCDATSPAHGQIPVGLGVVGLQQLHQARIAVQVTVSPGHLDGVATADAAHREGHARFSPGARRERRCDGGGSRTDADLDPQVDLEPPFPRDNAASDSVDGRCGELAVRCDHLLGPERSGLGHLACAHAADRAVDALPLPDHDTVTVIVDADPVHTAICRQQDGLPDCCRAGDLAGVRVLAREPVPDHYHIAVQVPRHRVVRHVRMR